MLLDDFRIDHNPPTGFESVLDSLNRIACKLSTFHELNLVELRSPIRCERIHTPSMTSRTINEMALRACFKILHLCKLFVN